MRSVSCASVVFFLFMNCSQGTTQDIQNYQPLIHPLPIYQPQPVSFYLPVTQHLSALDPSFIQPLSFYPSVTQHLSALAALDPPFIQPLSFYPPVTQHLSALDTPFIQPLSNLYPSTHPSPSTYQPLIHFIQPFIQPLSNLRIFIPLPTRQPLIHPLSNAFYPLIHPLSNLYPSTHPSPSIYQPLIQPLTFYPPVTQHLSALDPTFILLPTRHPASISPWSTVYQTFIQPLSFYPPVTQHPSALDPPCIHPFSNLFCFYPPVTDHLSALDPPSIQPSSNLCPTFIQPLSFYPPVTQHLSAFDPPFIEPLSFYPPVTQHLSALDPPFTEPLQYPSTHPSPSIYQPLIHPLSDLYPSTHPSPSIYPPFIHPLSYLYPSTHPSPSTYQPLIQPLSSLYPSTHRRPAYQPLIHPVSTLFPFFILLPTRHPASISPWSTVYQTFIQPFSNLYPSNHPSPSIYQPLSFYPPVTQHRSAFDSPFIQPLSFYPPVTQHLSALDQPFIQPVSFYPPAPSIYQPLIHPLSFYPPVTQHLHQPAEARSSTCPLSGKLSCHAEPGICPPAWLPLWLAAYRLLETVAERRFGAFGTPRFLRVGNFTICPSWPSSVWLAGQLFRPAVSRDCEVWRRLSGAMHSAGCIALVGMAASPGTPRTARRQHKGLEASAPWQKRRLVFCSAGSRNEKGLRKEMGKLHCIATACCTMNYREMLKMVAKRSLRAQKQNSFSNHQNGDQNTESKSRNGTFCPLFFCACSSSGKVVRSSARVLPFWFHKGGLWGFCFCLGFGFSGPISFGLLHFCRSRGSFYPIDASVGAGQRQWLGERLRICEDPGLGRHGQRPKFAKLPCLPAGQDHGKVLRQDRQSTAAPWRNMSWRGAGPAFVLYSFLGS